MVLDAESVVQRSRYRQKMKAAVQNCSLNIFQPSERSLNVEASTGSVLSFLVLFPERFHTEPFRVKEVSVGLPLARVLRDSLALALSCVYMEKERWKVV